MNDTPLDARPALAPDTRRDRAFLGHPAGLGWLCFTEFWERFSYYGMQLLLALYMTHALLLPGHVEHVLGFGPFGRAMEAVFGAHTPQAMASAIVGLYSALVYLTPIAGGWLADRGLGRTNAVTLGALLMAAGHFVMASEAGFLVALALLSIGVGFFKGNISSQVGNLYRLDDPRRADAFQLFLLVVQLAVVVSPLVCGTLGEVYGWHWGFGAAGVGMLIGLVVYRTGRRTLPPEATRRTGTVRVARPPLSRDEKRSVWVLVLLVPILAMTTVCNLQAFNAYILWAEKSYDLVFFGKQLPVTWLFTMSSFVSSGTLVASLAFWRWFARRWRDPDESTKLVVGAVIAAAAPLVLAAASRVVEVSGQRVGLGWAVAFEFVNDIGFANLLPVSLALFTRAAPVSLTGLLVGVFYLHLFIGNLAAGRLGGLLETMPASAFWTMHAAIVGGGALLLAIVRWRAHAVLAPIAPVDGRAVAAP